MAKRIYCGFPVRDATAAIRVQPNDEDILKAIPRSPNNCVYANCLKRQWNAVQVWMFNTIAYVQVLDKDGNQILERFAIPEEAQKYLHAFDRGEVVHPGGFMLVPPKPSKTLESVDKYNLLREDKRHKSKGIRGYKKASGPRNLSALTRPGPGKVRFIDEVSTVSTVSKG